MKRKIILDTFFIISCAIIAKALSFIIRILFARSLSLEAMHYYTILSPTLMLALTLSQLSLPTALSKLIAKYPDDTFVFNVHNYLLLRLNVIVMVCLWGFAPLIASILGYPQLRVLIWMMIPIFPITSISATLKNCLSGLQMHRSAAFSQIPEEIVRILFLILFYPQLKMLNDIHAACVAIGSIALSEVGSVVYLWYVLQKSKKEKKQNGHQQQVQALRKEKKRWIKKENIGVHRKRIRREFWQLALPASMSRLVGSLTYFLEPFLLALLAMKTYMNDYTYIYGYIMPFITMPSFLSISLANYLLPSFVHYQQRGENEKASKLCFYILVSCTLIGGGCAFVCYCYGDMLLEFLYKSDHGLHLLKMLAVPFAFYSLQPVLASLMHGLNMSKESFFDTLYGCLVRLGVYFLSPMIPFHIVVVSLVSSMLLTTIMHAIRIAKVLLREG